MNHFLKLSIVDYYLKNIENSNNDIPSLGYYGSDPRHF